MSFISDLWGAATERVEGIAEGAAAGLLSGIKGETQTTATKPQVETGENGKGATLVEQTPTGIGSQQMQTTFGTLPGWVLPVGVGVGAFVVLAVIVKLVK